MVNRKTSRRITIMVFIFCSLVLIFHVLHWILDGRFCWGIIPSLIAFLMTLFVVRTLRRIKKPKIIPDIMFCKEGDLVSAFCPQFPTITYGDTQAEAEKDIIILLKKNAKSLLEDRDELKSDLKHLLVWADHIISKKGDLEFNRIFNK